MQKEIDAGREPTTPKEWDDFMIRMAKKARHLGNTKKRMSANRLAGFLRDEGINAHEYRPKKDD